MNRPILSHKIDLLRRFSVRILRAMRTTVGPILIFGVVIGLVSVAAVLTMVSWFVSAMNAVL
jgi:hypothetical protein